MKLDIVVNSMIQQVDRSSVTQLQPAALLRTGDVVQGRVMLTADDKLQVRLDNGTLLSAVPTADVLLSPGAIVTLRVNGRMDGQYVMQLLSQEMAFESATAIAGAELDEALVKGTAPPTPQSRSIYAAIERMNLPVREETVRQAMEILATFPGLEPEKAVFIAANRLPVNQNTVDTLNRLVDEGATTGEQLEKLAGALAKQIPGSARETAAPGLALLRPSAQEQAPSPATPPFPPQQSTGQPVGGNQAPTAAAIVPELPGDPVIVQSAPAEMITQAPGNAVSTAPLTETAEAVPSQPAAVAQLNTLAIAALGPEGAEQHADAIVALSQGSMPEEAVSLALEGAFADAGTFAERLQAFVSALPAPEAAEVKAFLQAVANNLKAMAEAPAASNSADATPATVQPPAEAAPAGVRQVLAEIARLFVNFDGEGDKGEALATAASQQKSRLQSIAEGIRGSDAAGTDALRQLNHVEGHVRLISDISQYVYQQLPVQINDKNRTVELYVMSRRKGAKKIDPANANILIALDTDNLGRLEAMIGISNKNLRLRFGVEKPSLVGYINGYTAELNDALQAIGFKISDIRTQVTSEPVTVLTAAQALEPAADRASRLDIKL